MPLLNLVLNFIPVGGRRETLEKEFLMNIYLPGFLRTW